MWLNILERTTVQGDSIVHNDFSENIKEKPKFEPQDAHFSGAQHSLHCAYAHPSVPNGEITYFYHSLTRSPIIGDTLSLFFLI